MSDWTLTDAKNRFSELVDLALNRGPQRVNRRKGSVIVISMAEYERLRGKVPSFKEYLTQGESLEGLDLKRDSAPERNTNI